MSGFDSSSELDSDAELQRAFAAGELKPGLNAIVPFVRREKANNVAGMKRKLAAFKSDLGWKERLDLTNEPVPIRPDQEALYGDLEIKKNRKGKVVQEGEQVHNDFKREMAFYRQAQASVLSALPKLAMLGIKTKRENDYFAQMAKSDEHMQKIRENLINREKAMERSEKAKKMRALKKTGKQVQREVLQQRQKEKKEMIENVKKYKKGQKANLEFLDGMNKNQKMTKGARMKKDFKETKYGYGGQKKKQKHNSAASSADMSRAFNNKKFDKKAKGKNNSRPGKSKRQQLKGRKRR